MECPCPATVVGPDSVHVLLVDDERLSRVVVANLLRKCNYKGEVGGELVQKGCRGSCGACCGAPRHFRPQAGLRGQ